VSRAVDFRELLDISISFLVVFAVFGYRSIVSLDLGGVVAYLIATLTAFVLHELAHRSVAVARGAYARYEAWYPGLLIALILAIASRGSIVFVAPGAVKVYEFFSIPSIEAEIALAGPLANIVVAIACLLLGRIPALSYTAYIVGYVNAFLAFFNLLPIPPLDGYKVLRGRIVAWVVLFLISLLLLYLYH
jgi:Zn-dependent protease